MAETSYPFAAASAGGGSQMVSQAQWQGMAQLWGSDTIDFELTNVIYTSNELPFHAEIIGTDLVVQAGSAWVGGFYYKNDSPLTLVAPTNSGAQPRTDLVVVRVDMAASSVNLAIKTGVPSSNPQVPLVDKTLGGLWEMPLWIINLGANNGARTLTDSRPYRNPGTVYTPWNATQVAENLPNGSFIVDMDSNSTGHSFESYKSQAGYVTTRTLGKTQTYTPSLVGISNPSIRQGRWRWIAPHMIWFSLYIENTSSSDLRLHSGNWTFGITLPTAANASTGQVFQGHLDNNGSGGSDELPNFNEIVGKINRGNSTNSMYCYYPGRRSTSDGLDGVFMFPRKGFLTMSGIYEVA